MGTGSLTGSLIRSLKGKMGGVKKNGEKGYDKKIIIFLITRAMPGTAASKYINEYITR